MSYKDITSNPEPVVGKTGILYRAETTQRYPRVHYPTIFNINQTNVTYPHSFAKKYTKNTTKP